VPRGVLDLADARYLVGRAGAGGRVSRHWSMALGSSGRLVHESINRPVGSILLGMTGAPRRSARERILDVADRMFYERGIQAVGVELIAAQARHREDELVRQLRVEGRVGSGLPAPRAERGHEHLERELAAHGGPAAHGSRIRSRADRRGAPVMPRRILPTGLFDTLVDEPTRGNPSAMDQSRTPTTCAPPDRTR